MGYGEDSIKYMDVLCKKNIPGLNKYLALEDNTKNILLKGEGSYKVKYGTIAEVNVEFVSHNGKLMDNGYTFEVVPEIVKNKSKY
ncbi:hypothetical protein P7H20_21720 [Paenibacillus larvae]|nr:hypothetical protein [Paenibacillus larvae]MDT2276933.1 hypothetical protein [Paenibacillus larvae]